MSGQQTLENSCSFEGIGLHTGAEARCVLHPSRADSGIRFLRSDLPAARPVPAHISNVIESARAMVLSDGHSRIGTIEHLLAALSARGIDNALVELSGPEIPILDGSAWPFLVGIAGAGVRRLEAPRRWLALKRELRVEIDSAEVLLKPASEQEFRFTVEFDHPLLRHQQRSIKLREFQEQVARARTFVMLEDVEQLRQAGLAFGGSLDNTLVLAPEGWLNGTLRYPDEPVRHKLLDAVGDLALLGRPLLARYEGARAGHAVHRKALRMLVEHPDWLEPSEDREAYRPGHREAHVATA